jgi:hypothetical protein
MANYGPPPDNEVDKTVYELLFDGLGQTSFELFVRSDLTIGEIQVSLARLLEAGLVNRTVGSSLKQVYWSRSGTPPGL